MALGISEKLEESSNLQGDPDNEVCENNLTDKDLEKGDGEDLGANQGRTQQDAPAKDVPAKDPNLIEWDGPDDPGNPMNWSRTKKWIITIVLGLMTFCVTFASTVFSTATVPTAIEYGVSTEVTTLGTSLFVLGFAVGPLVCILSQDLEQ
jgi:MFS transporter, DHA1 family, multidrug resistance protein